MKEYKNHPLSKRRASGSFKRSIRFCMLLMLFLGQTYLSVAQEGKISISINNVKLEEAISQLEAKSGYHFLYNSTLINTEQRVSAVLNNATITEVLNSLFRGTDIKYKIDDKQVILYLNSSTEATIESAATSSGSRPKPQVADGNTTTKTISQYIIRGNVKSREDGQPQEFISVVVKGGQQFASTDAGGNYTINVNSKDDVLVFSMVGFNTLEEPIRGRDIVDVELEPEANLLDNAVVIGYGRTTQRMNTGAVSSVSTKVISEQTVAEPLAVMQGRVSGLFISSSSGMPGSEYNIQLRGLSSIDAGTQPLFIIDGVPFISESLSQFSAAGGNQSPLSSINPSDIERIDVLKDADATAIYGSRGGNGVILITTKSGRSGKTKIDFEIYSGIGKVSRKVDMLNPDQYRELRQEAFANDGVTPDATTAPDILEWGNKTTDWQKYLIGETASHTDAKLSISGGSERTSFLLSGTYRYQSNVMVGNGKYDRAAAHFNVNHRSKDDRFVLTAVANYSTDNNTSAYTSLAQYYNLPPNLPMYDSNNNLYWYGNTMNPIALTKQNYSAKTNNLIGNATAKYTILKGLEAKVSLGYNYTTMDQMQTFPEVSFNPATYVSSYSYFGNSRSTSYIIEPQATYTRTLWGGVLSALVGATWQESHLKGNHIEGKGYSNDNLLESMKAASTLTVRSATDRLYKYQSVFGRLNYIWQDKYLLNLTYRRDGSSRFGPGNRFGDFGAVGAGWIISNEPFMSKILPVMNFTKLRASYGVTGNDQIGDYAYLDSWSSNSFSYSGISGLSPARLSNDKYKWEENRKFEVGLELGFLDNRIFFKTDYYLNRTNNLLINFSLSTQTGFSSYVANLPAEVENTGWEFDVNGTILQGQFLKWESGLNLTIPKNKLLKYPDLENSSYAYEYIIGQPVDIVKGYHFLGVDPQTGIAQFLDIDKSGSLTDPEDFVNFGSPSPKLYGGFWHTLKYKNLELNFLLQFVKQDGPSINYGYMASPNGSLANSTTEALDRWRKPGDITSVPRASATSSNEGYTSYRSYYRLSDAVWGDASYIRLKNLTLSYDLSNWAQRIKLSRLQVYIQAQNLFAITNYIGFDPETQGLNLPLLRTFSIGLRMSL